VRTTASRLLELGLVEVRGAGRNRRYHLTAAFYRVAEDRNAYVRVRSADPIQQEQMVLSYVTAYGTITRDQVAALYMLSPEQARAVLKRLTAEEKLVMRGARRGAHYVLPNAS
jgi:ATP-dependent DNA helicase RecG